MRQVTPWYSLNSKRDASPCVIRRKYEYFANNAKKLAKYMAELEEAKEKGASSATISRLTEKVTRWERKVEFTRENLRAAVRYAIARIEPDSEDGKYLREHIYKVPALGGKRNSEWHDLLQYYATASEEFILTTTLNAGIKGAEEAAAELMAMSANLTSYHKSRTPREDDDAEQQAFLGIMRAASMFAPHRNIEGMTEGKAKGLARFSTYAGRWIKRMMEVRRSAECPPGNFIVGGERKKTTSLVTDEDQSSELKHPVTFEDLGLKSDVSKALSSLNKLEREVVTRHLMGTESVAAVARDNDVSPRKLAKILDGAKGKLSNILVAHASG